MGMPTYCHSFWRNNFRGRFEMQYRLPNNAFQADAVVVLLKLVSVKIISLLL
jgi:hypothetical protein